MFGSDILRTAIPQPRRGRIPRRTDEPLRHPRQLLGRPALTAASPLGCRGRGPRAGASSEPLHPAAGSGAGAMPGPESSAASELLRAALRRGDAAGSRGPGSSPPTGAWQSPQTQAADLLLMRHGRGGHRSGISVCRGCSLGGWAHGSPGCLGRERWGQCVVCGQLVPDPGGLSPLQDLAGHREDRRARVTWGHAALPGSDCPHGTGSRGERGWGRAGARPNLLLHLPWYITSRSGWSLHLAVSRSHSSR